jgi:hypothetical protein
MQHAVHEDGAVSEGCVTHVDSGYYVAGTRVSLDSIVYAFLAGQTAEAIPQSLPVSRAVEELLLIASATSPEDCVNRICYLPL